MLMYFFNQEILYYIQIIMSLITSCLIMFGAYHAFQCDICFQENRFKEGRNKIIRGALMILFGFILCYIWLILSKADFFKNFQEESYGTPSYLVQKRDKEKEKSRLRGEEVKLEIQEKDKLKEEKKKLKQQSQPS